MHTRPHAFHFTDAATRSHVVTHTALAAPELLPLLRSPAVHMATLSMAMSIVMAARWVGMLVTMLAGDDQWGVTAA